MRASLLIVVLLLSFLSVSAEARVGWITLANLVGRSEFIGIVTVERVKDPWLRWFGRRTAIAAITEAWKGQGSGRVEFLAESTWTCDISGAIPGEKIVLFLVRDSEDPALLHIAHSGRGRMPLIRKDDRDCALYWTENITLPEHAETFEGPTTESRSKRLIPIDTLKRIVLKIIQ